MGVPQEAPVHTLVRTLLLRLGFPVAPNPAMPVGSKPLATATSAVRSTRTDISNAAIAGTDPRAERHHLDRGGRAVHPHRPSRPQLARH